MGIHLAIMWGWITGGGEGEKGAEAQPSSACPTIEGLPSPTSEVDFQMAAAELLEEVRKYGEMDNTAELGWSPVSHSTPDVDLFERQHDKLKDTGLTFMKCVGVVKGATPQDILGWTLEGDLEKRKEFDPDINLLEMVKEITPTIQVTRTHFVAQSINFPEGPFSTDHVRGVAFNGIIMERADDATKIVFMGWVNPMGWVPTAIINAFRGKITERIDVF